MSDIFVFLFFREISIRAVHTLAPTHQSSLQATRWGAAVPVLDTEPSPSEPWLGPGGFLGLSRGFLTDGDKPFQAYTHTQTQTKERDSDWRYRKMV